MAQDPRVLRILASLPDLPASPEWAQKADWYRENGFDIETISPDVLVTSIIAPWLRRMLDDGRNTDLVAGVLLVVEDLRTSGDPVSELAAESLIEYQLFRTGRDVETTELVGPATEAVLVRLHEKWAPWRWLIQLLDPFLRDVIATTKAAHPTLKGWIDIQVGGPQHFAMYASFQYHWSQRYEDLLVGFWVYEGVARFELGRGSGEPVSPEFGELLIAGEAGVPAYDAALQEYVAAAVAFTWEHLPSLLPALAQPYDREE